MSRAVAAVAVLATLATCGDDGAGPALDAGLDAPAVIEDGFPAGAIAMFLAADCPNGWELDADLVGRTIVPSSEPGTAVGTPYERDEHRAHQHPAAVRVELPATSFSGIAGGGNAGVAGAGTVAATIATAGAEAGPPYVQLRPCRKRTAPQVIAAPPGVIAFFDGACPAGWAEPPALAGRLLIALPAGASAGTAFGGEPLAPGEQRTHTHALAATLSVPPHGIALVSGCCAGGYGAAGDHAITATADAAPVDVPYLQLRACVAP